MSKLRDAAETEYGEWIPIRKKPKVKGWYLVYKPNRMSFGVKGLVTMEELDPAYGVNDARPISLDATHWMPLPQPPKGKRDE